MSFTCGAATTDDISCTFQNLGATGVQCIMAGWVKPTTLTAGRGVVGAGTSYEAAIGATTSELLLRTDNTTDGQWTTTGVGLTVGQWKFIAIANSCTNTGPASAWRVWSGTSETPPVECTVTQTVAPVGNFVGSSAVTLGNKGGAGVLAFQGEIGTWVLHRAASTSATSSIPLATGGTITASEAEFIFQRYVARIWKGEWIPFAGFRTFGIDNDQARTQYLPLDFSSGSAPVLLEVVAGAASPFGAITLSGVTNSGERGPRPMLVGVATQPMQRMRR